MADQLLFFFLAMLTSAISGLMIIASRPRNGRPAWAIGLWTALAIILIVGTIVLSTYAVIAVRHAPLGVPFAEYFNWVTSGRATALSAGACAGIVLGSTAIAVARLRSKTDWSTIAALGISPPVMILFIMILGMPDTRRSLGLTSFEGGGFKVAFENKTNGNTVAVQNSYGGLLLANGGSVDPRFTGSGTILRGMTRPARKIETPKDDKTILSDFERLAPWLPRNVTEGWFESLLYFEREASYLRVVDSNLKDILTAEGSLAWHSRMQRAEPPPGAGITLHRHQTFLRSLRGLLVCAAYHHQIFPTRSDTHPTWREILYPLTALAASLQVQSLYALKPKQTGAGANASMQSARAAHPPGNTYPVSITDKSKFISYDATLVTAIERKANTMIAELLSAIPPSLREAEARGEQWSGFGERAVNLSDCLI